MHGIAELHAFRGARVLRAAALAALSTLAPAGAAHGQATQPRAGAGAENGVSINHVRLPDPTRSALEAQLGTQIPPGDYWYDALSGLFGLMGGPAIGYTLPGQQLGGPLPPDASGGGTNVFVNGRELHPMDVAALTTLLGPVMPGRYWLRYDGYYGIEGGLPLGNVILLAQQRSGGAGYNRTAVGGHIGSDGQTSFYLDPGTGCSVIPGGGVSC